MTLTMIIKGFLLLSCSCFVFAFFGYIRKYHIFESIYQKAKGQAEKYDEIKRKQIAEDLEKSHTSSTSNKKETKLLKLYKMIRWTGILESIPGFSEIGFLILIGIIDILIFFLILVAQGPIVAIFTSVAFLVCVWYILSLIAYNRKIRLESLLLQFTHDCASASKQYSSLIDIFGMIYPNTQNPLKSALKTCYMEAKQTGNNKLAIQRLKDKFDSVQFSFVLDNLETCNKATGNYYVAAEDIASIISIYCASHEQTRALLRNGKINTTIMFIISIIIIFLISLFLGNVKEVLLETALGNILLISLGLLYLYSLNMKTK